MKSPLVNVEILSIYKVRGELVLVPKRMAFASPDTHYAIKKIAEDVQKEGGRVLLSDLFRSYDMQFQAHLDWRSGKKRAYSPPPGGSMHEAGRAFDISLEEINISLEKFWEIASKWGVVPIIDRPSKSISEAWHFECRGSHALVYNYYESGKASNMKSYHAMVTSAIMAIGVDVDKFKKRQKEAYLQSCIIRLGGDIGNMDGVIGKKSADALVLLGVDGNSIDEVIEKLEHLLQEKFPDEFQLHIEEDISLFDYETPEHINEGSKHLEINLDKTKNEEEMEYPSDVPKVVDVIGDIDVANLEIRDKDKEEIEKILEQKVPKVEEK